MNSEKILQQMLDIFYQGSSLNNETSFELALQILTWAKLSFRESLSLGLRLIIDASKPTTSKDLLDSFSRLSYSQELGENKAAFENTALRISAVPRNTINAALDLALNAAQNNLLNHFNIPEELYISLLHKETLFIPKEVIEVMSALAGNLEEKTVYCPYDTLCLIAGHVREQGGIPSVEIPWRSPIPWLISILADANIHIIVSDPLQQPAFVKEGQLQKFDISIAFPPLGKKISAEVVTKNLFNRFKERTSSGSVLALRHIIAQTEEKAVVAIPNSILFGRGAEHSLREDLLHHKMIETVISMPPALLPFHGVLFSILVLNVQGRASTVRFVNGAADHFSARGGKNRSTLVNLASLIETCQKGNDEATVAEISVETIIKNDANLEISRYVLSTEQKVIQHLFSVSTTRKLFELVEFLRPSPLLPKNETEGISALEVSSVDFPDYGYLTTPEKQIVLSPRVFNTKEEKSFLRSGDIIIAMKGNAGKLAIIPDNAPQSGHHAWVVNQSCLIMRSKGSIDPRVLFIYLRSDVGQTLLKSLILGATVPLIQLHQLKDVEIIVPDAREAESIIKTFEKQVQIQAEIKDLKEDLQHLSKTYWKIPSSNQKDIKLTPLKISQDQSLSIE